MDSELGAWLRQQREDRGWSKHDMARRLIRAGHEADDTAMPELNGMLHNIHRWEREGGVSERHKLHYCRAYGIHPSQFGPDVSREPADPVTPESSPSAVQAVLVPEQRPAAVGGLADSHPRASLGIVYRGGQESRMGEFAVEHEVMMAAHEASDHAAEHEQHGIGEATLEQLRADLTRLSQLTDSGSSLSAFLEARRVRDRAYRLLNRRLWPREQSDLYFVLGCVNALMGVNANRLGYPDAAEELIRAGWVYANAIDHNPLRGMLRERLSYVMYWRGRFREAHDLAVDGLQYVSQGPLGAELYVCQARAAARTGDPDTARHTIGLAHAARERDFHNELLDIGGEFAVSLATHHAQAGAALTDTRGAEREAVAELERSVSLYDQGPAPGEQHWFGGKALAGTDLAVVRLKVGALDAAATALEPVLILPPAQRVSSLTARLARVREELAAPVFQGSSQARDLGDQIEAFDREAVTVGLHSLS